jgi:simple sugar transport system permease protein
MSDIAEAPGGKTADPHPHEHWLRGFLLTNRAALGSLLVLLVMLLIFFTANPRVFSTWNLYTSVMTTLPVALFMTVPLVFVVTAGEIDLSFPAIFGFASLAFAVVVQAGFDPFLAIIAAIVVGTLLGFGTGALVVYAGLSSLVATLGMNFMLRGAILILTQSKSIAMPELGSSLAFKLFASTLVRPCRCSGPSPSWCFVRCCTTATASARRCTWSATIPTAPTRWASTSSSCG